MKRDSTNEDTNGVGLLLLIGAALFAWALWQNHRAVEKGANAAEWPETDGEVQYSYVDSERRGGGRYRPARDHYFPVVHYSYSVDGNGYSGSRVQIGNWHEPSSLNRAEVDRWIHDRWFPNMTVSVRYNPEDPSKAVLIPGSP